MSTKVNNQAISGLYHSNKVSRIVLNEIAAMPRQNETLVETLEMRIVKEHKDISRREIVRTLKQLQDYGAGEFIEGRRGHPSRFRWIADSISVSKLDEAFPALPDDEPMDIPTASVLISHRYQLRPDMTVMLQLPSDITAAEAHRLSLFLQSLPY